jgi:AAA domain/Bifunctional DNA primase/polymerase, N-terminal
MTNHDLQVDNTQPEGFSPPPFHPSQIETPCSRAAEAFVQRGITPVPVLFKTKKCSIPDCYNTYEYKPQHFRGQTNIGILTGVRSGGLKDIDVDCLEALTLTHYLPVTTLRWGRLSKPLSHHLYRVRGSLENKSFQDPLDGKMLIELRGDGQMTVAPPSTHESGEKVEYEMNGEPVEVDADDLSWSVSCIAAASLVARHWPEPSTQEVAMALAGMLLRGGWSEADVTTMFEMLCVAAGDKNLAKRLTAITSTVKSISENEQVTGYTRLCERLGKPVVDKFVEWLELKNAATPQPSSDRTKSSGLKPSIRRLHEVEPEEVRYLWSGRIPYGKISLISGNPGVGKSILTIDLAARLTRGEPMPGGFDSVLGSVAFLVGEDGVADTLKPRFMRAGGDDTRISILILDGAQNTKGELSHIRLDQHLDVIKKTILHLEDPNVMLVIDPLNAFLGKADGQKDQDLRDVLSPLSKIAEETGAAIIIVNHLLRSVTSSAINEIGGSTGLIGAARAGFMVGKDPQDDERCILAAVKQNLSRGSKSLAYRVVADDEYSAPYIAWEGECDYTADDLNAPPQTHDQQSAFDDAVEFLRDFLQDGPKSAQDVYAIGKTFSHSRATLTRASKNGEVEKVKLGMKDGWCWMLKGQLIPSSFTGVEVNDT